MGKKRGKKRGKGKSVLSARRKGRNTQPQHHKSRSTRKGVGARNRREADMVGVPSMFAGEEVRTWSETHEAVAAVVKQHGSPMPNGWSGDPSVQFAFTWMHIMMEATGAPVKTLEGFMKAMEFEGYTSTRAVVVLKSLFDSPSPSDERYVMRIRGLLDGPLTPETLAHLEDDGLLHPQWREWGSDYKERFPIPAVESDLNKKEADQFYRDEYPETWQKLSEKEYDEDQRLAWFFDYERALNAAEDNPLGAANSMLCGLLGVPIGTELTDEQTTLGANKLKQGMMDRPSPDPHVNEFLKTATEEDMLALMHNYWEDHDKDVWLHRVASTAANNPPRSGPEEEDFAQGVSDIQDMTAMLLGPGPEEEDTSDEPTELGLPPPNTSNRSLAGSISASDYESMMQAEAAGSDFSGPKSAEDYNRIMKARKERAPSRFTTAGGADPMVAARWEVVKADDMDAAESYFDFLTSLHPRNCNVIGNKDVGPGNPDDYAPLFMDDEHPSDSGFTRGSEIGFEVFRETLSHSMIFAFPGWWYDSCEVMWTIKNHADMTEDMRFPYPRARYDDAMEVEKWSQHSRVFEVSATEEEKDLLYRRKWEHHANILFPDETVPARHTFIGLESVPGARDNQSGGFLVYQRGQQGGMALAHSCPTTLWHPAENRFVGVDAIYMRGILLDQTGHFWPDVKLNDLTAGQRTSLHGSKSIWGLFHAYVFNKTDCPAGMDFVRISFVAPLYMDALGWTSDKALEDAHGLLDGAKGTMGWTGAGRCSVSDAIHSVIAAIDDHRSVVHNFSRGHKKKRKKAKQSGVATSQKRFQRVHMSNGPSVGRRRQPEMDVGLGDELPKRTLDHRVRVRSHERVYVRRGPKPLLEADRVIMRQRGYRIYFHVDDMTYLDKRRLKIRAKQFPDGVHYIAMKDVRVQQHERGPEGAEIVPQVHVVNPEVVAESMEWELSDERQDDRGKGK